MYLKYPSVSDEQLAISSLIVSLFMYIHAGSDCRQSFFPCIFFCPSGDGVAF